MTQTLESMRRRIESAEDLYAVVRVMKALAAASIRQCERAVESLADSNRTIEAGLQIVLRNRVGEVIEEPASARWGIIAFGSDQGMCGSFNDRLATYATERIRGLNTRDPDSTLLVVGARLEGRMEDAGFTVHQRFAQPSTVSGITPAVHDLLLRVEELRFVQGIEQFLLIHHRPTHPVGSSPASLQLLPVDPEWLRTLAGRRWPSRTLPTHTMDWRPLLSALIRQHLFVALFRAFAESMASENASRLAAMQSAEKNIQNHLSQLTVGYHQARQQAITEELLDIVAGFETLTNEP